MTTNAQIDVAAILNTLRQRRPLVHNVTNFVAMNFSANALLACGASPVMAHAKQEVAQMASLADALVLNIGTLEDAWIEAMLLAGQAANQKGTPVVLDPVGAGATELRTKSASKLLDQLQLNLLRGNASEIGALLGLKATTKGVDSSLAGLAEESSSLRAMAKRHNLTIAVTGETDLVTDGRQTYLINNGHPMLTQVTAAGCALSAICGAFLALDQDRALATACALAYFGVCAEIAAEMARGPGSFQIALLDALANCQAEDLASRLRVEIESEQ